MPATPVDARLDLSDPDLLADHLPLDEFAWLRRHEPVRWNPQPARAAYGDAGYWALTRHADVTAVTRSQGWSVETSSAFVRRLDESDPTGESTKNLLLCMDPPRHTRVRRVGNRCFTPRALAGLEDDLRERAHRIVWEAKRNGSGDFVARRGAPSAAAGDRRPDGDSRRGSASSSSTGATRWPAAKIRSTPAPTSRASSRCSPTHTPRPRPGSTMTSGT